MDNYRSHYLSHMSKERLKLFTPICARISERISLSSDGALGAMCISACSCPDWMELHGEAPHDRKKTIGKWGLNPKKWWFNGICMADFREIPIENGGAHGKICEIMENPSINMGFPMGWFVYVMS